MSPHNPILEPISSHNLAQQFFKFCGGVLDSGIRRVRGSPVKADGVASQTKCADYHNDCGKLSPIDSSLLQVRR